MFAASPKTSHRTECPDPCSNSAFHKRCLSCSKPLPCRIIAWITQNSLDWLQPIFLLMRVIKETLSSRGCSTGFLSETMCGKNKPCTSFAGYPWCKDWAQKNQHILLCSWKKSGKPPGIYTTNKPCKSWETPTLIKWCRIYSINIMKRVILETFQFFHQSENITVDGHQPSKSAYTSYSF